MTTNVAFLGETEMVDLFVGSARQHFRVHKSFLCTKISYFEKMFNSKFKEAVELKAEFPEDDPKSFDILMQWVYTNTLPRLEHVGGGMRDSELNWNPNRLHKLADKLCLPLLMDQVLDNYRRLNYENNRIYSFRQVLLCYANTSEPSTLRRFARDCFVFAFFELHPEKRENYVWTNDAATDAILSNSELAADVVRLVRESVGKKLKDPSTGDDCDYHCHGKDEACPSKKT